jgi:hypothetical protein
VFIWRFLNIYFLQKKKSRKNKISVAEQDFKTVYTGKNRSQSFEQGFLGSGSKVGNRIRALSQNQFKTLPFVCLLS